MIPWGWWSRPIMWHHKIKTYFVVMRPNGWGSLVYWLWHEQGLHSLSSFEFWAQVAQCSCASTWHLMLHSRQEVAQPHSQPCLFNAYSTIHACGSDYYFAYVTPNGLLTLTSSTPPAHTICDIISTPFYHWHSTSKSGLQAMPSSMELHIANKLYHHAYTR